MENREKVIGGLEACTGETNDCAGHTCPYWDFDDSVVDHGCRIQMELDALSLLKEQEEEIKRLKGELHGFGDLFHTLSEKAKVAMEEQPKVVRCKDCKQSGIDSTSYPRYWCSAHSEYHDGTWFCADGERKEVK